LGVGGLDFAGAILRRFAGGGEGRASSDEGEGEAVTGSAPSVSLSEAGDALCCSLEAALRAAARWVWRMIVFLCCLYRGRLDAHGNFAQSKQFAFPKKMMLRCDAIVERRVALWSQLRQVWPAGSWQTPEGNKTNVGLLRGSPVSCPELQPTGRCSPEQSHSNLLQLESYS